MESDGTGGTFQRALQDCQDNKEFLVKHFEISVEEDKSVKWLETGFYNWLKSGCPSQLLLGMIDRENYIQPTAFKKSCAVPALKNSRTRSITTIIEPPLMPTIHHKPVAPFHGRKLVSHHLSDMLRPEDSEGTLNSSSSSPGMLTPEATNQYTARKNASYKLEYISPQRPAGTPEPTTILQIMLAITCHAIHTNRDDKTLSNLTPKNISLWMYKDFSFKHPEACHEFVRIYAQEFMGLLPPSWHNSRFYKSLQGFGASDSFLSSVGQFQQKSQVQFKEEQSGEDIATMTYPIKRRALGMVTAVTATLSDKPASASEFLRVRPSRSSLPNQTPTTSPPRTLAMDPSPSEEPSQPIFVTPAEAYSAHQKAITSGPEHHVEEVSVVPKLNRDGKVSKPRIKRFFDFC
jgi:hypothetical protein